MFAYCNNSPVNCIDPSGDLACQNSVRMSNDGGGARSLNGNPQIDSLPDNVGGKGVSFVFGFVAVGYISIYHVYDPMGNRAVAITLGGGGGLVSGGTSYGFGTVNYSNANTIEDLAGWGVALGTTLGYVGGEISSGKDVTGYGLSGSLNLGAEFHAVITHTFILK